MIRDVKNEKRLEELKSLHKKPYQRRKALREKRLKRASLKDTLKQKGNIGEK